MALGTPDIVVARQCRAAKRLSPDPESGVTMLSNGFGFHCCLVISVRTVGLSRTAKIRRCSYDVLLIATNRCPNHAHGSLSHGSRPCTWRHSDDGRGGAESLWRLGLQAGSPRRRNRGQMVGSTVVREDSIAGVAGGGKSRGGRLGEHKVDGGHRGPLLVQRPEIRGVPATGQRQDSVLAASGEALRRACVVPEGGRDSGAVERKEGSAATGTMPLGNTGLGRDQACRHAKQPVCAPRVRPERFPLAGDKPGDHSRGQSSQDQRRAELSQHFRSHPDQLERNCGRHFAENYRPRLD